MQFYPRLLTYLLCCLPVGSALAQASPTPEAAVRPGETRTFVLKTSPIDLLIPHNTTLWLSGETQLSSKLSWQVDLGYVFRQDGIFDLRSTFPDMKFRSTDRSRLNYNLKTEVRRYIGRPKGLNGFYGAGQLMYKVVHYNSNQAPGYDWVSYTDVLQLTEYWTPTRRGAENNYHLREREAGGSIKFGYQHIFSRFTFDCFTGLNIRNQYTTQDLGEPHPEDRSSKAGGTWVLLPVLGGKFGWAF